MRRVLEDLIDAGLVEYEFMTNKSLPGYPNFRVAPGNSLNWQSPVFRTCLKRYRRRHRWMGEQALVALGQGGVLGVGCGRAVRSSWISCLQAGCCAVSCSVQAPFPPTRRCPLASLQPSSTLMNSLC